MEFLPLSRRRSSARNVPPAPAANSEEKRMFSQATKTPPWKEFYPANSRQSALANFDNMTCLREVGGVVGKLRYLRRCHMLSPSPFPPFFAHSRFRCSRASFASRSLFSLIYTDRVPGTAYCKPESKIQNPTLQFDLD